MSSAPFKQDRYAAIIGSQIGSRFMARKMQGETLTRIFACVLAAVGLIMLVRVF